MSDKVTQVLVEATFVFLIAASALTWAIVIVKLLQQGRLLRHAQSFNKAFEKVAGLPALSELSKHNGPVARLAFAGVESWQESAYSDEGQTPALAVRRDLLELSLRHQLQREKRGVETGLPVLASIGSTAPFIGLFGTVLGIIHALTSISGSGSASLEVVAGPIGEALTATAIGIAVAIPAVLAYNYFLRRLKTFVADLEEFANGLVSSAVKNFIRIDRAQAQPHEHSLPLQQEVSA